MGVLIYNNMRGRPNEYTVWVPVLHITGAYDKTSPSVVPYNQSLTPGVDYLIIPDNPEQDINPMRNFQKGWNNIYLPECIESETE